MGKKKQKHEEIEKKKEELPPQQSEVDSLKEQLKEKERVIEETKNKLLRALADFDNFKKRINLEKDDLIRFSNEVLIKELLPIIDNFEKALESMQKAKIQEEVTKGLALIKRQVEDTFTKFGVKEIEAVSKPYDPNYHEAILTKESDKEEGVILEEVQKGYTIHEKLLRPSMVIVSKKK